MLFDEAGHLVLRVIGDDAGGAISPASRNTNNRRFNAARSPVGWTFLARWRRYRPTICSSRAKRLGRRASTLDICVKAERSEATVARAAP
jgi:hypothetical protein